jgi:penicillin-binding protein 2
MAGKTGTAQVISRRGTAAVDPRSLPMHLRHRSLFVGFAPADNPTIAIAIAVEGGGYGGSTAGPMARKIFDAYLLGKMPEKEAVEGREPGTGNGNASPSPPVPQATPAVPTSPVSPPAGAPAQDPSPAGRGVRVGEDRMGGDLHGVAALVLALSRMHAAAPVPTLTPTPLPAKEGLEAASTERRPA